MGWPKPSPGCYALQEGRPAAMYGRNLAAPDPCCHSQEIQALATATDLDVRYARGFCGSLPGITQLPVPLELLPDDLG